MEALQLRVHPQPCEGLEGPSQAPPHPTPSPIARSWDFS